MKYTANLEEARIRHAFDVVSGWPLSLKKEAEAISRAQGLPVQLRSQGLVVTIATLMGNGRHAHLADTIALWLLERGPTKPLEPWAESQGRIARRLLSACNRAERSAYLAAQMEALALAEHIKRFASALAD